MITGELKKFPVLAANNGRTSVFAHNSRVLREMENRSETG